RQCSRDRSAGDRLQRRQPVLPAGNLGADFVVPGVPGLTLRANAAYDYGARNQKAWATPWTLYSWDGSRDANGQPVLQAGKRGFGTPQLGEGDLRSTGILLNLIAEYH